MAKYNRNDPSTHVPHRNPNNLVAKLIRDTFDDTSFRSVGTVFADLVERHGSVDSPELPTLESLAWFGRSMVGASRDQLIEVMAICYWEALQITKRELQAAGWRPERCTSAELLEEAKKPTN